MRQLFRRLGNLATCRNQVSRIFFFVIPAYRQADRVSKVTRDLPHMWVNLVCIGDFSPPAEGLIIGYFLRFFTPVEYRYFYKPN